ncbi:hypothetical protein L1049_001203 [Liquidambar formosana]|uniref:Histone acetyltransferase n=1 Tax=Liquidambar formosana TaxID=63359 RepID=A0AAP0R5C9_LIQFO
MPRPGPRPYECVRRAWHSDRHRPMRGSIIQQIFRLVTDAHNSATRKNKEWLEKLPIVVLKAEEIMYSKANSEAEYMDLETLWDRVIDAINTIIRKDETETGEFLLQPCIEAALNLGCVPVKASRSQRHNNPRSYLTPRAQEPASVPPRVLDNTANARCPQLPSHHSGNQLTCARSTTLNSHLFVPESDSPVTQNNNPSAPSRFPFSYKNFSPGSNKSRTVESNSPLNVGSVYPLYYGTHYQTEESQLGFRTPDNTNSNTIFVGTPIGTSIPEAAEMGVLGNLFSREGAEKALNRISQADLRDNCEKAPETQCDLSLRLGLSSDPCMSMVKSLARETEDVGSSNSQDGSKFSDLSPHKNKEFCFFPRKNANDPSESCSSKWNSEGDCLNMETTVRKRKAPSGNMDDGQFCWQPELPSNQFTGRMRRMGL